MKKLSNYLPLIAKQSGNLQNNHTKKTIDEKTIFFLVGKVISLQYGIRGRENISPKYWKEGKLFLLAQNSLWAGEVWANREYIRMKINEEIGSEVISEIKVTELL